MRRIVSGKTVYLLVGLAVPMAAASAGAPPASTLGPAQSQVTEIEPGVRYAGGTRVGAADLGVSFVIPEGWVGVLPPNAELFLLGSDSDPGLIVVVADRVESLDAAVATLDQPLPIDTGLVLQPRGDAKIDGRRLSQDYSTIVGGQTLIGRADGIVGPTGVGVAFVAVGPESGAARYQALISAAVASLQFREPPPQRSSAPSKAAAHAAESGWNGMLRGMKLHYIYSATGYANEEEIDLCADGTFVKRGSGGGFGGGASGAWQNGGVGRWSVSGDTLSLRYDNGEEESYTLSLDGNKLLLNGKRYFRVATDRCN